jgi:hypothetical protein
MKKILILLLLVPFVKIQASNINDDVLIEKMSKDEDVIKLMEQSAFLYVTKSMASFEDKKSREALMTIGKIIDTSIEAVEVKFPEYATKTKSDKTEIMEAIFRRSPRWWQFIRCIMRDVVAGAVSAGLIQLQEQRCLKRCYSVAMAANGVAVIATDGADLGAVPEEMAAEFRGCIKLCSTRAQTFEFTILVGIIFDVLVDCLGSDTIKDLANQYFASEGGN